MLAGLQAAIERMHQLAADDAAWSAAELETMRGQLNELAALWKQSQAAAAPADRPAPRSDPLAADEEQVRAWVDALRALGDDAPARQAQALVDIRAALAGADPVARLSALHALTAANDVQLDRQGLRDLILPVAREGTGPALRPAFYALYPLREPADLQLVQAAWARDPATLDDSILHLLFIYGDGRLHDRSEEIALETLADYAGENRGITGLWGADVGPRLEQRLLELSRSSDQEVRHGAIYFGLSTLDPKRAAVVDALIATLADPDPNNHGRALWGLSHGVQPADQARVVEALVSLHALRTDGSTRRECERLVALYGGPEGSARLAR
jgi:hypothetical protein